MKQNIINLNIASIVLSLIPTLATAGGYSWYRDIYNTSDSSFGLWVENSYQGNYYVTCNGITYKNPSMLTIKPGQICKNLFRIFSKLSLQKQEIPSVG